jgi:hypothetical protein
MSPEARRPPPKILTFETRVGRFPGNIGAGRTPATEGDFTMDITPTWKAALDVLLSAYDRTAARDVLSEEYQDAYQGYPAYG